MKTTGYQRFPAWMLKEMQPEKSYKELVLESYGRQKGTKMLKAMHQSLTCRAFKEIKPDFSEWDNSRKPVDIISE